MSGEVPEQPGSPLRQGVKFQGSVRDVNRGFDSCEFASNPKADVQLAREYDVDPTCAHEDDEALGR